MSILEIERQDRRLQGRLLPELRAGGDPSRVGLVRVLELQLRRVELDIDHLLRVGVVRPNLTEGERGPAPRFGIEI